MKSSLSVYVTYWMNRRGFFYYVSEASTCAGDQLKCTRQQPVGWEEWINFTLERRANRHLRICGGISLFPLLISLWRVKRENIPLLGDFVTKQDTFPRLETEEVKLKSVILPTQRPRTHLLFGPCLHPPAAASSSFADIDHTWIGGMRLTLSINRYFPAQLSNSSLSFQRACKALKQNIQCNEALFMAFLDSLPWS